MAFLRQCLQELRLQQADLGVFDSPWAPPIDCLKVTASILPLPPRDERAREKSMLESRPDSEVASMHVDDSVADEIHHSVDPCRLATRGVSHLCRQ